MLTPEEYQAVNDTSTLFSSIDLETLKGLPKLIGVFREKGGFDDKRFFESSEFEAIPALCEPFCPVGTISEPVV